MFNKLIRIHLSFRTRTFKIPYELKIKSNMSTSNVTEVKEIKIPAPYGYIAGKVWNEFGSKTPILALHGWMDNAGTWDQLCPCINKDHPIIAIDFPGHGLSSHPPMGMGTYVTDNLVTIQRIICHMKWKQVILLGHSMGGGSSIFFTSAMPEFIQKLIALDIIMLPHMNPENQPHRTGKSLRGLMEAEEKQKTESPRYEYNEIVERLMKSYGNSLTKAAAKTLLIRGSRKFEDGKYSFNYSPLLKCPSTLSLTFDQEKEFAANVKCDFLLIKAINSPCYKSKREVKEILERYRENSKNFIFEVLPGEHHIHLTDPEPVADLVNSFLNGVPQDPANKQKSEDFILSNL